LKRFACHYGSGNYGDGQSVNAGIIQVKPTLSVFASVAGITDFNFNVNIVASG
jgi:hypothetical protein